MLICQSSRDTRLKTVKSFHAVLIQCLRWWFGFHGPTINWSSTSATLQLDSILSCQLYGLYSFCLNKHRGKLIQTVSPVFGMEPLTDRMDGPPLWLFYISFQVQSEEAPENDQRWRSVKRWRRRYRPHILTTSSSWTLTLTFHPWYVWS